MTEPFYVWGNPVQLYLYSRQRLVADPAWGMMLDGPLTNQITDRVLRRLESNPPATVLINLRDLSDDHTNHPVFRWIATNYVATTQRGAILECHRGSPIVF